MTVRNNLYTLVYCDDVLKTGAYLLKNITQGVWVSVNTVTSNIRQNLTPVAQNAGPYIRLDMSGKIEGHLELLHDDNYQYL